MMIRKRAIAHRDGERGSGILEPLVSNGIVFSVVLGFLALLTTIVHTTRQIGAHHEAFNVAYNFEQQRLPAISQSALQIAIPDADVIDGSDNSDGHQIVFYARASSGAPTFTAETYDANAHIVQESKAPNVTGPWTNSAPAIANVAQFAATDILASEQGDSSSPHYYPMLGSTVPNDIRYNPGYAIFNAGRNQYVNRVVEVTMQTTTIKTLPPVDLIPGVFPAAERTEITATYTPPPPTNDTCLTSYSGSSGTGWTPVNTTGTWQWYQTATPCPTVTTPPPTTYISSYAPNCPPTFYVAQTSTAAWQQQPAPSATTPPPTTAIVGYANSDPSQPIYQSFAWNQGPCPNPTFPPVNPTTPTPGPTPPPVTLFAGSANDGDYGNQSQPPDPRLGGGFSIAYFVPAMVTFTTAVAPTDAAHAFTIVVGGGSTDLLADSANMVLCRATYPAGSIPVTSNRLHLYVGIGRPPGGTYYASIGITDYGAPAGPYSLGYSFTYYDPAATAGTYTIALDAPACAPSFSSAIFDWTFFYPVTVTQ